MFSFYDCMAKWNNVVSSLPSIMQTLQSALKPLICISYYYFRGINMLSNKIKYVICL